ncbi:hypothetical protein HPB51_007084 [Rhipicephalus microplus]|uniref:Uncharacterized protein n=1 Tax=Rhipicephalus microplus TaxID=6941 RepID=A0A9J6DZP1_RHIMP|nr:hypothetical protein HPB51_007084 [Rhipicephalus microplus]
MGLQHFRLHRKCSHRSQDLIARPAGESPFGAHSGGTVGRHGSRASKLRADPGAERSMATARVFVAMRSHPEFHGEAEPKMTSLANSTTKLRCALSGAAEVCAQRFFTTGPFKSSVGGKETFAVTQTAVECQRRDPSQVNSLSENSGGEGSREGGISSV